MDFENDEPEISVVVPVYNGVKDGLKECLSSILNQTYKNIELIVINDYSGDQSEMVINSFCDLNGQLPITHIRHEVNQGISSTWNEGIKLSKGSYILLIQQDCILQDRNALSKAISIVRKFKIPVLSGAPNYNLSSLNKFQTIFIIRTNKFIFPKSGLINIGLTENKCDIINREVFKTAGYFDENLKFAGEDFIFSSRVRKRDFRICFSADFGYTNNLMGENSLIKLLRKEFTYGKYLPAIYIEWRRNNFLKTVSSRIVTAKVMTRIKTIILPFVTILSLILLPFMIFTHSFLYIMFLIGLFLIWGIINAIQVSIAKKTLGMIRINSFFGFYISYILDFSYSIGVLTGLFQFLKNGRL